MAAREGPTVLHIEVAAKSTQPDMTTVLKGRVVDLQR